MSNIAFVLPALFLGGAETQFRYIIQELGKKNFKVTVYLANPIDYDSEFVKNNSNIKFRYLGTNLNYYKEKFKSNKSIRLSIYILLYFKIIIHLYREFKTYKYKVVVSYDMFFAPLIPIFKKFKSKVIFSERTAQEKILNKSYLARFYNKADFITCNSDYTLDLLKKIGVKDVITIYNGIYIPKNKLELNIKDKVYNIYIIARINHIKNQIVALKALKKMPEKRLYLVGECQEKKYYDILIKYIRENKLENRVEFIEYTHDILNIYKKSDIVLLPSYEEGMANVILESFLNNRYCISSKIPTNKFLLDNGRGGLFDPNNEDELVQEIIYYENLSNNDKKNIIENNRIYLEEFFSLSKMTSQYENIIEKLLSK